MQVGKRMMMVGCSKLPYDAEVEYLESTGTQYIDTGATLSSTSRVVCDAEITGVTSGTSAYVFGAFGGGRNFGVNIEVRWRGVYCVWSSESNLVLLDFHSGDFNVDLSSSGLFLDGVKRFTPSGSFTGSASAYLVWANGTGQGKAIGKIYSCKILDAGNLVRDFIPVRFTNEQGVSEGAMYDRANPTVGMNPDGSPRTDGLYRNRGNGAFVIGPDKTANSDGGGGA